MSKRPITNYRSIYKNHHGPIPKDEFGRSYDIHHIDGDAKNNDPSNLCAITILEHYEIHKNQNNPKACNAIAARIKIDPEEHRRLSSEANSGSNNPSYGKKWWSNGLLEIRSKIKPKGDDWIPGRSKSLKDRVKTSKIENGNSVGSKNCNADHNIYAFFNIVTNETLNSTRFEFRKYANIGKTEIRKLITGVITTHKNWMIK